ncbi:MAG: lipid A deacylase LpxR family protein [Bacteroidales bacterium]|nr:lipid A deacylase LpxR family protein [Bacteroidota bacterium]MBL6950718.1 lipid A deacylase LpxR family protein [Bacteroidales bacterium]
MNRLVLIGFLVIFLSGCMQDEPVDIGVQTTQPQRNYPGEAYRSYHPLSFVMRPDPVSISRMPELPDDAPWKHVPKHKIQRYAELISTLEMFRDQSIVLDLNEPVSRKYLKSFVENGPFKSMITLSSESYFHFQLDNDIFNYTDRFFTSGLRVDLIVPAFRYNPLNFLMIPYWGSGINYYGICVVQNIYTPSTTRTGGILLKDRPYAGYLYVGSYKITNDLSKRIRFSSEFQIGIIGPSSFGGALQIAFHSSTPQNHPPLGWEYQIQDDLLLNYKAEVEKGILSTRYLESNLHVTGILGTVYTNISGGIYLRTGLFNPYFRNLFLSKWSLNKKRGDRNFQCYFFIDLGGRFVGYDATLEGGVFNRTSIYTLPSGDMNRLLLLGSAGLTITHGGIQIKGEQFLLSPEFKNGWWHKWLSISLTYSF